MSCMDWMSIDCVLGRTLVQDLLYKFLFPSSKLIMESSQHSAEGTFSGFSPKFVAFDYYSNCSYCYCGCTGYIVIVMKTLHSCSKAMAFGTKLLKTRVEQI